MVESVCIFSSIERMLKKSYPSINESDIQMLAFGIAFDSKTSRDGVVTIDVSFEKMFKNIDEFLGSKSIAKKYVTIDKFYQGISGKIGQGNVALLYLNTGKLAYHDVYINNPAAMHCITLHDIMDGECYIYDSHIRVGRSFSEYEGYIQLRQIFDTIEKVIYFEIPPLRKLNRNQIFQHYKTLLKDKQSIDLLRLNYKEHLEKIIFLVYNTTDLTEVCTRLFSELNIFGPKHILINLLFFLENPNFNISSQLLDELDSIINKYEALKNVICKTGVLCDKKFFETNINSYLEIPNRISCVLEDIFN